VMLCMKWCWAFCLRLVLTQVAPTERSCPQSGLYFDATSLQCRSCSDIDSRAELVAQEENPVLARLLEKLGSDQCRCASGLVQCYGGDRCTAFIGKGTLPMWRLSCGEWRANSTHSGSEPMFAMPCRCFSQQHQRLLGDVGRLRLPRRQRPGGEERGWQLFGGQEVCEMCGRTTAKFLRAFASLWLQPVSRS